MEKTRVTISVVLLLAVATLGSVWTCRVVHADDGVSAKSHKNIVLGLSTDSVELTRSMIGSPSFEVASVEDFAVFRAYRLETIPLVVLTSPYGRAEWIHYGPMTESEMRELMSRIEVDE